MADTTTGAVTLPPPGPALRLHMAADRLRRAGLAAQDEVKSNDYWGGSWVAGMTNGMGGAAGKLGALLPPELALELADWLDGIAAEAVRYASGFGNLQEEITDGHPTVIANHILAGSVS
jgi:hypothetical protein